MCCIHHQHGTILSNMNNETDSNKINVNDIVMFVPRDVKWNKRCYMIGTVIQIDESIVSVRDVAGHICAEYKQCVVKI